MRSWLLLLAFCPAHAVTVRTGPAVTVPVLAPIVPVTVQSGVSTLAAPLSVTMPAPSVTPLTVLQTLQVQVVSAQQTPEQDPKPALDLAFEHSAALTEANPVSAATLAQNPGLAAIYIDAAAAERGQINAVVNAAGKGVAVLGAFQSASDPFLKPKIDEGLRGAVLEDPGSLKETLKFLARLYLPPLGQRSVGPSDVTGYLSRVAAFLKGADEKMVGGVLVSTMKSVEKIESIVKAAARGLKLIIVDTRALDAGALERVARAAASKGITVMSKPSDDLTAVDQAFARFADVPRQAEREGVLQQLGFLMSPDLALAKRMRRHAGALWIDGESGHFPLSKIQELLAAVEGPVFVRTTQFDNPDIDAYLAAGAAGVVAPQVATAWQAKAFVEAVKKAKPGAKAVVMIENKRGLENVEEILRVPGIDVLFIGPYDLSLSLGVPMDSDAFRAAVARIEAAARAAGVPLGGLSKNRSQSYRLQDKGYAFLTTVSDQGALTDYFDPTSTSGH